MSMDSLLNLVYSSKRVDREKATRMFSKDIDSLKRGLREMIMHGYKVIPSKDCDNFDKVLGCKGHED